MYTVKASEPARLDHPAYPTVKLRNPQRTFTVEEGSPRLGGLANALCKGRPQHATRKGRISD